MRISSHWGGKLDREARASKGKQATHCVPGLFGISWYLGCAAGTGLTPSAKTPCFDELITRLGYSEDDRKAPKADKVVSKDIAQEIDDQSIAAAAMLLPDPVQTPIAGGMRNGRGFDHDLGFFPGGALRKGIDPAERQAVGREPSKGDLTELLRAIKEERRSRYLPLRLKLHFMPARLTSLGDAS